MAFQDYSHLTERRKVERQQKLRKRITIAVVLTTIAIIVISCGAVAVIYRQNQGKGSETHEVGDLKASKTVSHLQKGIKMICSPTDYKETCESSLTSIMSSNTSANPKDLLKAAINVIINEVDKAFNFARLNINDPKIKGAVEDCHVLLKDAKEELRDSISHIGNDISKISSKTTDLNNWLSAVMSYQETCIDGFPEGKLKTNMQNGMKTAKEMTSNALAIVSEVSTLFSLFPGFTHRHLLSKVPKGASLDNNGLPHWMSHNDRRMLRAAKVKKLKPNVTVAKDGSGQFTTISGALAAMPKEHEERYIIYVKMGIYDETVIVEKKMVNITMYGDGSQKTIVTGSKNFVDGVRTFQTATFAALGEGFIAQGMGFRNTAGPEKHQAVALRVQSDRSVFLNCRMEGYQDTLYAQTHRQFYRSCVIAGTVDFIFGDATTILQNCMIIVRKPLDNQQNIVTAQGRIDKRETTGIILQNCRILPDKKLVPDRLKIRSYLGRPWKEFSRTIIMESTISDLIHPDGWLPWEGDFALKTLYYAEYKNRGPGAIQTARIKWPGYKKEITKVEAMKYTVVPFLQDDWIRASGAPAHMGLFR
ncbi:hypothetical protein GIB67_009703 [Kingdonia uniflora]|uniref:Pectinesterase n=1 Tax=Kingdonia uniflora TaxID=39325 RepID=A0A7J7LB17_9MAGN|nr:hypothetical protein GIB67_009703 [Kingdonia uniflora]